mmetsp:Transcript_21701/g.42350  ORF Transcript_21701/g.42350 Transcript_21701/m.42350 type:complete len:200 (-) Transcript_21701:373-972(-)
MEVAFNKLLEQLASQHVALLSSSGEIGPRASVCCDQLLHPAPTNVQVEDAKVEPCEPMANEEAEPWVQTTDEDEEDDIATPHSSFNRQVSISNLREFRVREEYNVGNEELRFVRSKRFDLQEAMKQLAQKQKQQLDFRIFHKRIMDSEEEDIEKCRGFVMHPHSSIRLVWDLPGLGLLVYYFIATPLSLLMQNEGFLES